MRYRHARADDRLLPRQQHCSHGARSGLELCSAFARARSRRARRDGSPRRDPASRPKRSCAHSSTLRKGKRGVAAGRRSRSCIAPPVPNSSRSANEDIPIIIQLETVRAFENLEAIVSVPGVDVAWIGHYDLTVSMGIPAQFDHPRLLQAMDDLVAACRRHGVAPGFLPPTPESAAHWIGKGFRMISLGSDIGVFLDGMRKFRAFVTQGGEAA